MDILIHTQVRAGRITLNRPRSLNALSLEMVHILKRALLTWVGDPDIDLVILDATGYRAFCVGGDIREVYDSVVSGNSNAAYSHCRIEYELDAYISNYPKPIVVFMHGTVMGGGIGISSHASHSISTQRTSVSMPECSIGFSPDSGATSLLAAAPGYLGEYLGLTGAKMDAADAIYAGFANIYVPDDNLPKLKNLLAESGTTSAIDGFSRPPGKSELKARTATINRIFSLGSLPEIVNALEKSHDDAWHQTALKQLRRSSPISLMATLQSIRQTRRHPGVESALKTEFRVVTKCMDQGDFREGVRAAVVDRDRKPVWRFKHISDVPKPFIDGFFTPAEGGDLDIHEKTS